MVTLEDLDQIKNAWKAGTEWQAIKKIIDYLTSLTIRIYDLENKKCECCNKKGENSEQHDQVEK